MFQLRQRAGVLSCLRDVEQPIANVVVSLHVHQPLQALPLTIDLDKVPGNIVDEEGADPTLVQTDGQVFFDRGLDPKIEFHGTVFVGRRFPTDLEVTAGFFGVAARGRIGLRVLLAIPDLFVTRMVAGNAEQASVLVSLTLLNFVQHCRR